MITVHEEYLVDEAGNRTAVVLPLAEWQQIKEELEELDDIRAYDEAKAQPRSRFRLRMPCARFMRASSIDLRPLHREAGPTFFVTSRRTGPGTDIHRYPPSGRRAETSWGQEAQRKGCLEDSRR